MVSSPKGKCNIKFSISRNLEIKGMGQTCQGCGNRSLEPEIKAEKVDSNAQPIDTRVNASVRCSRAIAIPEIANAPNAHDKNSNK